MKLPVDRISFFTRPSSGSTTGTMPSNAAERTQAALVIQRWWKHVHLKQTASELFHFVHELMSLKEAHNVSFDELSASLLDPEMQDCTQKLLLHIEKAKDIFLIDRSSSGAPVSHGAREFLAAYMIVGNSSALFESPTDIDEFLLSCAQTMLELLEDVSDLMTDVYLKEHRPLNDGLSTQIEKDKLFIQECKVYLELLHKQQIIYFEAFSTWESKHRYKLAHVLISKYMELESIRFGLTHSLDPRMMELYEGYSRQQETLRTRVKALLGDEGEQLILDELQTLHTALEARKWAIVPSESLMHELALNPELVLPFEACMIGPQNNIDEAILALPEDKELILDVLQEIIGELVAFTPNNQQQISRLQEMFNRAAMAAWIEDLNLHEGLYTIVCAILEEIKRLESPAQVPKTNLFLRDAGQRVSQHEQQSVLLKEALDFIYYKISKINLDIKNTQLNLCRGSISRAIVATEQKQFQERLLGQQFNLEYILGWIDKFVTAPTAYRLDSSMLCSKYMASYVSHALMIAMLQEPEASILHIIPETFYLDKLKIVRWHAQYQHIVYATSALSYLDVFCRERGIGLTSDEISTQTNRLIRRLESEALGSAQEKTDDLIWAIDTQLVKHGKQLSPSEKASISSFVQQCCLGKGTVIKIINKRLGDELSSYFFKGRLPEPSNAVVRRYGLAAQLSKLGQEILPVLRLHAKVHGPFYQQQIDLRLWKPFFSLLKETKTPDVLPELLSPQDEGIKKIHASLHRFAFVLSGLALISQSVVYSDMWNVNVCIKNERLKCLAQSCGLIDMITNPNSTKDDIELGLMELMEYVASEYDLDFETAERKKINGMFRLAKQEHSLGAHAFLDELIVSMKHVAFENQALNIHHNSLLSEFSKELTQLGLDAKEILEQIKGAHTFEETDPLTEITPLLRTGRAINEVRLAM